MTPKGQKLPQDLTNSKELNKSINPDGAATVQAATQNTDMSEAPDMLLPVRTSPGLETARGMMTSLNKKIINRPTRPPQEHKEEARPPQLPTKRGGTTIEEAAGHRRREEFLLLQTPTHPRHSDNRDTDGHKGLVLLENAAASYWVSIYTEAGPGQLTNNRPSLINKSHPSSLLNGPRKPTITHPPPTTTPQHTTRMGRKNFITRCHSGPSPPGQPGHPAAW